MTINIVQIYILRSDLTISPIPHQKYIFSMEPSENIIADIDWRHASFSIVRVGNAERVSTASIWCFINKIIRYPWNNATAIINQTE